MNNFNFQNSIPRFNYNSPPGLNVPYAQRNAFGPANYNPFIDNDVTRLNSWQEREMPYQFESEPPVPRPLEHSFEDTLPREPYELPSTPGPNDVYREAELPTPEMMGDQSDLDKIPTAVDELPAESAMAATSEEAAEAVSFAEKADMPIGAALMLAQAATNGVVGYFDNQNKSADLANQAQELRNASGNGQFGNSMQAQLHASMLYNAQQQTLQERDNFMHTYGTWLGPLSAYVAGKFEQDHVSDAEKNINFDTAFNNEGQAVNPDDYAMNSTQAQNLP